MIIIIIIVVVVVVVVVVVDVIIIIIENKIKTWHLFENKIQRYKHYKTFLINCGWNCDNA